MAADVYIFSGGFLLVYQKLVKPKRTHFELLNIIYITSYTYNLRNTNIYILKTHTKA